MSLRTNISSKESANRNGQTPIPYAGRGPALVSYLSRWIRPLGAIKSFRQYIRYATSFGAILEAYNGPIHWGNERAIPFPANYNRNTAGLRNLTTR